MYITVQTYLGDIRIDKHHHHHHNNNNSRSSRSPAPRNKQGTVKSENSAGGDLGCGWSAEKVLICI
ncbi:hypothetical protein BO86DRAFT_27298 [Aspergillus japonicus CBS 114.51]|uniref:Uncharacterized protein n=1 Tax=Aspergillus japonicus CBS 114.51 TaxID=1448312 RepID=A0A8T8WKI0_ASPJA|nr:hypothetical protein BO86DRAFT_27298 [Aspergillus japonicus CBS 114.51]RAH76223.1 hypothetical protein BO86DRAFT_27298 [Aspergillus japonicus CBS 114.51]